MDDLKKHGFGTNAIVDWIESATGVTVRVLGSIERHTRVLVGEVEAILKTGDPQELLCEAAALRVTEQHGLPSPRLVCARDDALVQTVLPGSTAVPKLASRERLRGVGAAAARIHAIRADPSTDLPLRTRHMPWVDYRSLRMSSQELSTPLLDEADSRLRNAAPPAEEAVFVHADLWQGNMLWEGDYCTGIIDWEAAGAGQPGVDLGSLRWDAAILFGADAADAVLRGWEEATGRVAEAVAYWDLVAALNTPADYAGMLESIHRTGRTDLDATTMMLRRDEFVRRALTRL